MKTVLKISIAIILVVAVIFALNKRTGSSLQKKTRFLMDTYCTIQAFGPKSKIDKAMTAAFDRMEEIDEKFNFLNKQSPLYAFNYKNDLISDTEMIGLIKIAQEVSERTNGAFDITIQPLVELWGFYGDSPDLPEQKDVETCLEKTGYRHLQLVDSQIKALNQNVRIDMGAIAKGYAISEAAKVLKKADVDSALIDAGGDIYTIGKIKGKNWKIGIRNPRGEGDIGVLEVSNLAVVTSGDYERFFVKEGIEYCHILDPRTGYPARELISVTVISPDPVLADAWATALFVLGPAAMELVEKNSDIEAMLITSRNEVLCSSGLLESMNLDNHGNEQSTANRDSNE